MNRVLCLFFFLVMSLFSRNTFAQAPEKFNYQAVALNVNGSPLSNQLISIRVGLREGSSTGTLTFQEAHSTTTAVNGQFNLIIGEGQFILGQISNIDWGSANYFIELEIDPSGGTNYQPMGTSQILSVPYSLFSNESFGVKVGNLNTFVGKGAGVNLISGEFNVAFGSFSGNDLTTGEGNSLFGHYSGLDLKTGNGNTIIGNRAGRSLIDGGFNSIVGNNAGGALTSGKYNTAVGDLALRYCIEGDYNAAFGRYSLLNLINGEKNTAYGSKSAELLVEGNVNAFFGYQVAKRLISGDGNTILGPFAGLELDSGSYNTFLGYKAGPELNSGNANIFIGPFSGEGFEGGGYNMLLGYRAGAHVGSGSKQFVVAMGEKESDVLLLGNFDSGYLSTRDTFHILNGGLKFPDGTVQTTAMTSMGGGFNTNMILNGNDLDLVDGGGLLSVDLSSLINDADFDPTNEYQNLSLSGNTLSLSNGNSISLPSFGDNLGNHIATQNIKFDSIAIGIESPSGAKISSGEFNGIGNTWCVTSGNTGYRFVIRDQVSTYGSYGNNPFIINQTGEVLLGASVMPVPALSIFNSASSSNFNVVETGNQNGFFIRESLSGNGGVIEESGDNQGLVINEQDDGQGLAIIEKGNGNGISIQQEGSGNSVRILHNGSGIPGIAGDGHSIYIEHYGTRALINTNIGAKLTNSGTWTDVSDSTKKFAIQPLEYGLNTILALNPVRYRWKSDGTDAIGFLAQEIEHHVPEVVHGEEGNMSLSYGQVVSIAVKAIQEQQEVIEKQNQRIEQLESRIQRFQNLEARILALESEINN